MGKALFLIDPSNYVGVIIGIWCGAYYGDENIPNDLREKGYKVDFLKEQTLKLIETASTH